MSGSCLYVWGGGGGGGACGRYGGGHACDHSRNKKMSIVVCTFLLAFSLVSAQYAPNCESLDARKLPEWYDQAKVGIILHWGVYSVPSYGGGSGSGSSGEWFWSEWKSQRKRWAIDFMQHNYPEGFTYPDFAPSFAAELFDPDEWADLFQTAGAK